MEFHSDALEAARKGLGLGMNATAEDVEKEVHRIFRSTFSTPDGRKALNILLTRMGYFSTDTDWDGPCQSEKRHVLADFAEYMRIELIGATDTVALTGALLDAAQD